MPIAVKNEENHQNKSSQSNHSKDVELVINVSKNHRVKKGHGISDNLPGIRKNRYGYVLDNSYFVEIIWAKRVTDLWTFPRSSPKSYVNCWFRFCRVNHRVRSKRKLFLLPNTKGLGNRLQLFCGLYFISIRHNCSIVRRTVLHFYYGSSS